MDDPFLEQKNMALFFSPKKKIILRNFSASYCESCINIWLGVGNKIKKSFAKEKLFQYLQRGWTQKVIFFLKK